MRRRVTISIGFKGLRGWRRREQPRRRDELFSPHSRTLEAAAVLQLQLSRPVVADRGSCSVLGRAS